MSDKWHGGKGDKSRISSINKFSRNHEKIFSAKNWRMWACWDGHDVNSIDFDESGLKEFEPISYQEFIKRLKK